MLVKRKFVIELLTNQTTVHDKSNNSKERKNTAHRPRQYGTIWCAVGGVRIIIARHFSANIAKFPYVVSIINNEQEAKMTNG
jgi:hypothetical protein